jgi:hypothetical protein
LLDALESPARPFQPAGQPVGRAPACLLQCSSSPRTSTTSADAAQDLRDTWLEVCEAVGLQDPLPLTVVREAWLSGLDQGKLSQRSSPVR